MSDPRKKIGCVIVAHGKVGECLINAVQGILGSQTGCLAVSNAGLGLPELTDAVRRSIEELDRTHEVILVTDMPGGSCHHVCQALLGERSDLHVISGVNLMMLLEFFIKRDRNERSDLIALMQERGRDSVRVQ